MYAQFRSQFPMGSLLSELLHIHEGKYIVRASIQVGGSTLATGLSSAHTIEQAEDQARSRALVVLGIEVSPPQLTQPHLSAPYPAQMHFIQSEPELPHRNAQARFSPSSVQTDFLPAGDVNFPHALEMGWNPSDSNLPFPTSEQQLSWLDSEPLASAQSKDYPTATPEASVKSSGQRAQVSQRESSKTTESSSSLASPIDLSEVIAQTDVELKRLGWSHVQGRRYLEKTYSKRSRQHLTDAELVEFLDYLTAQPANGKPTF
jgi:hypothetical protein